MRQVNATINYGYEYMGAGGFTFRLRAGVGAFLILESKEFGATPSIVLELGSSF